MTAQIKAVDYGRQTLILDPVIARDANVNIIGAGTVGSKVAVGCGRLGIGNMSVWDKDAVEPHNLPSQAFDLDDLDVNKAAAVARQVGKISDHAIVTVVEDFFTGQDFLPAGITILAVDDMDARKEIFESAVANNIDIPMVMDFRMGGNHLTIYSFNPTDRQKMDTYRQHNFTNEEAAEIPCGGRTVSYIGDMAGSIGANYVRIALNGEKVPFITSIDMSNGLVVQTIG
jgi:molybdopterin/thiamine biosynthesis adenylyltransferase